MTSAEMTNGSSLQDPPGERGSYNLAAASLEILTANSIEDICQRLTFYIQKWLPGCKVSILLGDPEKDRCFLKMENGSLEPLQSTSLDSMFQGIAGQVLQSGQISQGSDVTSRQQVAVPIKNKSKLIGVVTLTLQESQPLPGAALMEAITALVTQAAASIQTTRMYQAEQERLQMKAVLIESERKLSAGLKPSELPRRILEELAVVVAYERGSLLLREGHHLRIAAQHGFPDDDRTRSLTIPLRDGDVYKQIEATCLPVVIDDVTKEPGWNQVSWLTLNQSWLGLPLFSKGGVVGMVSLTRRERGAFSQEDVLLATTFALQAAVALENAALYEEVTRFNQHLEQMVQERTEELKKAYGKLERMDKNKGDFINVAAHELRTPLTIMRGYMQMLQADEAINANPFLVQASDGLQRGTQRLQDIIASMLDVAKIDNQVLDLKPEMVAISTVARRVLSDYKGFLEERKIDLKLVDLEGLPIVKGDSSLLLKVLQNVVINAIKYTPDSGEISISGKPVQDEQCGDCLELLVQDTGIGIDPEQQELIFEKFYSTGSVALHSSGKASFKGGGPGLGLAIARGIVLAHQGRIWVESERHDDKNPPGSCFHILLPVAPTVS